MTCPVCSYLYANSLQTDRLSLTLSSAILQKWQTIQSALDSSGLNHDDSLEHRKSRLIVRASLEYIFSYFIILSLELTMQPKKNYVKMAINTWASQKRQSLAAWKFCVIGRVQRLENRNNKNHIIHAYFSMQCLLKFLCVIIQVYKIV